MINQNIEFGKLPPQSVDLEEAVLGSILIDKQAIDLVTFLKPESFYKEANQIIYRAMQELNKDLQPVDILTVVSKLKQLGKLDEIGGAYYISTLTNSITTSINVEFHAKKVAEKAILRELIRYSNNLQKLAFDESNMIEEVLNFAERGLAEINNFEGANEPTLLSNELIQLADELAKLERQPDKLIGLPSGIVDLDRITSGFEPGDMVIIAARPSMGKTALAIQFALNLCKSHSVFFISLEMTTRQLTKRFLSSDSELNLHYINNVVNLDWSKIDKTISRLGNSKLYIDDTSAMTAIDFRAKARRMFRKHKIEIIIVDYIQLMRSTKTSDPRLIVQECSRTLKQIAKELNIPVIALSQLNREAEDKIPKMSNLKEAGDIEQDADKVLFPLRKDKIVLESEADGIIKVEKNRNGRVGDAPVSISEDKTRWTDWNDYNLNEVKSEIKEAKQGDLPF